MKRIFLLGAGFSKHADFPLGETITTYKDLGDIMITIQKLEFCYMYGNF